MTTRIDDNRAALAMTAEEADKLFQQLAETVIASTAAAAAHEQKLAAVKAAAAKSADTFRRIIKPLEGRLTDYIQAHPERFTKPRMRQTEFGKYGLRSVTNLEITDETAALMSVKAQGIPAVITTEKLDKKAIEKAISDGVTVTGAELRTGEITKYDVKKELLDRVRG